MSETQEEEKAKELIQQRKAKAAIDAEKEEILKEKKRREEGKQLQETARQLEQLKKEKEREHAAKELKEDQEYRRRLKEQIQREKEERLAKLNLNTSGTMENSSSGQVNTTASTTSPGTPRSSNVTVLRVRLLNGNIVDEQFDVSTILGDVMKALNEKHKITEKYYFKMTFPNKSFTKEDEGQTLQQLNLIPNATLVMTSKDDGNRQMKVPNQNNLSYIQLLWNSIISFVFWFIGMTPTPPPTQSSSPSTFGPKGKVNHINSVSEYDKLKNTEGLVVVDISATWCGPCKKIAPFYDQLAREHPSVLFLHVDLDKFKTTISDLSNIKSVPTFLFFKNRRLVDTVRGANAQSLTSAVNKYK